MEETVYVWRYSGNGKLRAPENSVRTDERALRDTGMKRE